MTSRLAFFIVLTLLVALLPQVALAEHGGSHGLLIQIDGPVAVASGQTVGNVVVIDGDVTINGTVDGVLIVIDGRTVINGTVTGGIVAIDGRLEIGADAVVEGDVAYNDTDFQRDPGATIQGRVRDNLGGSINDGLARAFAWLSFFTWIGTTILMLLAGLVFAAIGGRQLWSSAGLITARPLQSLFAAFLLWLGTVVLGVGLLVSVIGSAAGIVLLLALGAVWGLGYLVAGARIGAALIRRSTADSTVEHPYLPTIIGVLIVQAIALVPVLTTLFVAYAGLADNDGWSVLDGVLAVTYMACATAIWLIGVLGTGALAYYAWQAWQRPAQRLAPASTTD